MADEMYLLNGKKFVFPEFIYNDGLDIDINFPAGFIQYICTISMTKTKDCQPIEWDSQTFLKSLVSR